MDHFDLIMIENYTKQKKPFMSMKKQTPTLKIKNITFNRQYTKNIDQELLNFHLRMGRNISHKLIDAKQKNKQNQVQYSNSQYFYDKKTTITQVFSIRAMNLASSSKLFLPPKVFANYSNTIQITETPPNRQTIRSQSRTRFQRNSQTSEGSKRKIPTMIADEPKRMSSCSPGNKKSKIKTQKVTQTLLNRQRKLLLTTNDKVFETNYANYCSFLESAASVHQIKIDFQDYAKPCTVIVGKGNNSKQVKDILKKRWWLKVQDKKGGDTFNFNQTNFVWTQTKVSEYYTSDSDLSKKFHNHFESNGNLGNKKELFLNLKPYYLSIGKNPFDFLPLTFHIKNLKDREFLQFKTQYEIEQANNPSKKQLWIVKPGENSNRGRGITIHTELSQIQALINEQSSQSQNQSKSQSHTFIVQKYIQKPFLYQKRKFDIRCYYLLVNMNNQIKAYWFKEGYIRTSCFQFNCNQQSKENLYVHLTNDAVQKNHENYGKYEDGNKIDYSTFKKYLAAKYSSKKLDFDTQIYENIKLIAIDSIKATYQKMSAKKKPMFQIFGLDFMIDEDFKPWLIEVNTNPCLETSCMVLERIIPKMLDDAFQLSVDLMYPPPKTWPSSRKHLVPNHLHSGFQLIFDEKAGNGGDDHIKQDL